MLFATLFTTIPVRERWEGGRGKERGREGGREEGWEDEGRERNYVFTMSTTFSPLSVSTRRGSVLRTTFNYRRSLSQVQWAEFWPFFSFSYFSPTLLPTLGGVRGKHFLFSRSPRQPTGTILVYIRRATATHTVFPIHRKHARNIAPNIEAGAPGAERS